MPMTITQRKDTPRHMPPKPGLHPSPVPPPPLPHRAPDEEEWRERQEGDRSREHPQSPPEPSRPKH